MLLTVQRCTFNQWGGQKALLLHLNVRQDMRGRMEITNCVQERISSLLQVKSVIFTHGNVNK